MAHLSDEQLVALARDGGKTKLRGHVLECAKCAKRVEMWRLAVESLPAVVHETVSTSEMHHLQAMFRHNGPEKQSVIRWVASLVRSSSDAVAVSVRGSATADLFEYQAGPFTMMLESGPMQGGSFSVHGQVFDSGQGVVAGSRIVVASDDGVAFVDALDEFGEFHVDVTVSGRYHVTVWTQEGAFGVEDLEIGGSSGG